MRIFIPNTKSKPKTLRDRTNSPEEESFCFDFYKKKDDIQTKYTVSPVNKQAEDKIFTPKSNFHAMIITSDAFSRAKNRKKRGKRRLSRSFL